MIGEYCEKRKGVYIVLETLLYYKYLHPRQDVRLFQSGFVGGFSARSFDTKFVTPILKKIKTSINGRKWLANKKYGAILYVVQNEAVCFLIRYLF